MTIKKVTVLGAGNMGSQIAAVLVNAGLTVRLLDIALDDENPNALSKAAYERITHPKKGLLFSSEMVGNITYGNFKEDLVEQDDADLFVEAVSENIQIKHDLWSKIAKIAKPTAILTTNTSGIPIRDIASILPAEQQERFLGLHFFNPPRFMKLIEVIPFSQTKPEYTQALTDFAITTLGKGVVLTEDVSGFVANRIGVYTLLDIMKRAEEQGLSFNDVDQLTGLAIGRPKTATYGLADLVGTDILANVGKGMIADPAETEFFTIPNSLTELIEQGFLGNKTGSGYYKREGRTRLVYDTATKSYQEVTKSDQPFIAQLGRNLKKNLEIMFDSTDPVGQFTWETVANVLYYSALQVPKATSDYKNIDRALVWGYAWKLGPFQLWDLIGFEKVKTRLQETFGTLPEWIAKRQEPFYADGETISQVKGLKDYVAKTIWQHEGSSDLYANDQNQLIFTLRTPNNSVTTALSKDIIEAVATLEQQDFTSMVVYSEGANFSIGANLFDVSEAIKNGQVDTTVAELIDQLHSAVQALKYSKKPIVSAVRGRALGGGAELLLYSPYIVAAQESYIGLVEIGVGVIPSGGGLAELAERVYKKASTRPQELHDLATAFKHVVFGKVSANAYEAKEMGFLRDTDTIIANEELVLEAALQKAHWLSAFNYIPATRKTVAVEGTNYLAVALAQLDTLADGGFATDYDRVIGKEVATVLSGGEVPLGTLCTQKDFMRLEKQGFIKLCKNPKTLERIEHMLTTKKPLRN